MKLLLVFMKSLTEPARFWFLCRSFWPSWPFIPQTFHSSVCCRGKVWSVDKEKRNFFIVRGRAAWEDIRRVFIQTPEVWLKRFKTGQRVFVWLDRRGMKTRRRDFWPPCWWGTGWVQSSHTVLLGVHTFKPPDPERENLWKFDDPASH